MLKRLDKWLSKKISKWPWWWVLIPIGICMSPVWVPMAMKYEPPQQTKTVQMTGNESLKIIVDGVSYTINKDALQPWFK